MTSHIIGADDVIVILNVSAYPKNIVNNFILVSYLNYAQEKQGPQTQIIEKAAFG